MFKKSVKIKSNSQIKGSERRFLKEHLLKHFPILSESDIESLVPKKDVVSLIRIVTSSDETVQVYAVQKVPIIFDIRGAIYPTICLLWKYPDLIPSFTTHPQVMTHLNSGADLMLAGVVTPPPHSGLSKYGNYPIGTIASVNLSDNRAPIAVGVMCQNSSDMARSASRGKCLTIVHLYGDKLHKLEGFNCGSLPKLGTPDWLTLKSYQDDFPELGSASRSRVDQITILPEIPVDDIPEESAETLSSGNSSNDSISVEEMDQLLYNCFFTSIKYSKSLVLPILTSNFYKSQMLSVRPDGIDLDLRKSSYKKLKPFLDDMCKDGIIVVKEAKKGVVSITDINKDHPKFNEFYIEPSIRPKQSPDESVATPTTSINESYIITPSTLPLFAGSHLNKGDSVQVPEIRKYLNEYVKSHSCQDDDNKRLVKPKDDLVKICKTENNITWEELMERVCESMKSCYKVCSPFDQVINKGKISPINISVAMRSGNKKVTLIDNLELYGIKIQEFAKECQHGVAASTSVKKVPGKKCDQLLVQGNQVIFVYNLLTAKYKVPQKYVKGLEYAPKKKK